MSIKNGKPLLVCNTGPLIALNLLGLERLLSVLFAPIVPQVVLDELMQGDASFRLPESFDVVDSCEPDPLLVSLLDAGEASVISTALDRQIPLVLMDEKKGRKVARRIYRLKTIGTARVLVEARRAGLVASLPDLFTTLRSHSYWISEEIVNWALNAVGD